MSETPTTTTIPSGDRYSRLKDLFQTKYGASPAFLSHAPGRVNLIGEHIDYCGYAVLPMAIEQDTVIAACPNDTDTIRLANTNPTEYKDFTCKVKDYTIDRNKPRWNHYFLCGYKGIVDYCGLDVPKGMDILLDGVVPASAGLSSSSSLVCCAALATSKCNGKILSKTEYAEVSQKCERHIGTEGGGMDQAISLLAEPGTAKLIEFNPVVATNISLPEGAVFVISNCCREMNKAATAHFNIRVAECRLAAQVIAKKKGLDWRACRILRDLEKQLSLSTADMVTLVGEILKKEPYTKAAICEILEVTPEELNTTSLSEKTYEVETFKLHNRALHVYSEASRVWQFKRVCDECPEGALQALGELMDASHMSCSKMYECSCEELDRLTQICREAGALGSRLTGAGWGGCAVSLVPVDKVESFLEQVTEGYYTPAGITGRQLKEALFASKPGGGAGFYQE